MRFFLALLFLCTFAGMAEAACPGGSTCTIFDGLTAYPIPSGTTSRSDVARAIDNGINILDFGADPTGVADSAAAIQAAIDYSINSQGTRAVYCPQGTYKITYPVFLDTPNQLRGSATAWSSATSYSLGTKVVSNGIQWTALQPLTGLTLVSGGSGYAINDLFIFGGGTFVTPALGKVTGVSAGAITTFSITLGGAYSVAPGGNFTITATSGLGTGATFNTPTWGMNQNQTPKSSLALGATETFWQVSVATPGNPSFNNSFSWLGAKALFPGSLNNSGCVLEPTFNNAPAFVVGPGNGNVVSGLQINAGGSSIHNCQQPADGEGIAVAAFGGGSSRTLIEESGVTAFNRGFDFGFPGTSSLGDSNTLTKVQTSDTCYGIDFEETQAFINQINDSVIAAIQGVRASLGGAPLINGGNYSAPPNVTNGTFTITSVSGAVVNGLMVTLTVSNPDAILKSQLCYANQQCRYTAFTFVTPDYGIIPFTLTGAFCASPPTCTTMQLTLTMLPEFNNTGWAGTLPASAILTQIEALTTLYAAERVTVFFGHGFDVRNVHVENPECAATELFHGSPDQGTRVSRLQTVFFDYDPSCTTFNSQFAASTLPASQAMQVFPFIYAKTPVVIEGMDTSGTSSLVNGPLDYLMIDLFSATMMKITNEQGNTFRFNTRQNQGTTNQFTGDYSSTYTYALGGGEYDDADVFTSWSYTFADQFRSKGWGRVPMMGYQPVPWSSPCLTPAQITTLAGALPAITNTGSGATMVFAVSYPLVFGGRIYRSCDWNNGTYTNQVSSHQFYSYGQNLAAGNVPNFSYSKVDGSPVINLNAEMMNLMFPGLGFQLTCNGVTASKQIVQEVHRNNKYIVVHDANQNGSPHITSFGKTCTQADSNFLQQAYSWTAH